MNEISALKYIFKEVRENNENEIEIMYNDKKYIINNMIRSLPDYMNVYDYIMKEEAKSVRITNEKSKEIATDYVEVVKITEEQFYEWLESKKKLKEKENLNTGKNIWMSLKDKDVYE